MGDSNTRNSDAGASAKRGASRERPDSDQDGGKIRKVGGVEDLGVLFKVKGQGPGMGCLRRSIPLRSLQHWRER